MTADEQQAKMQAASDRARPFRLLAGIIDALADQVCVTWFAWHKTPGGVFFTFLPAKSLPSAKDPRACDDMQLANELRSEVRTREHSVHLAQYPSVACEIFVPGWGRRDGKQRQVWPPPDRVGCRKLPLRVRQKFEDERERRAIAYALRYLDVDFLISRGAPDHELSRRVITWTQRIAGYLYSDPSVLISTPFEFGPPQDAWACDVTDGQHPAPRRYYVERCSPYELNADVRGGHSD